jgi:hypothetical protein
MCGRYVRKKEERSQITRHLLTDGEMGDMPEWYITIQAAKYLGVPPWDLADRPMAWQEWAVAARNAEAAAEADNRKQRAKKQNQGKKRKRH